MRKFGLNNLTEMIAEAAENEGIEEIEVIGVNDERSQIDVSEKIARRRVIQSHKGWSDSISQ
jgi:hypothetical protein